MKKFKEKDVLRVLKLIAGNIEFGGIRQSQIARDTKWSTSKVSRIIKYMSKISIVKIDDHFKPYTYSILSPGWGMLAKEGMGDLGQSGKDQKKSLEQLSLDLPYPPKRFGLHAVQALSKIHSEPTGNEIGWKIKGGGKKTLEFKLVTIVNHNGVSITYHVKDIKSDNPDTCKEIALRELDGAHEFLSKFGYIISKPKIKDYDPMVGDIGGHNAVEDDVVKLHYEAGGGRFKSDKYSIDRSTFDGEIEFNRANDLKRYIAMPDRLEKLGADMEKYIEEESEIKKTFAEILVEIRKDTKETKEMFIEMGKELRQINLGIKDIGKLKKLQDKSPPQKPEPKSEDLPKDDSMFQ